MNRLPYREDLLPAANRLVDNLVTQIRQIGPIISINVGNEREHLLAILATATVLSDDEMILPYRQRMLDLRREDALFNHAWTILLMRLDASGYVTPFVLPWQEY